MHSPDSLPTRNYESMDTLSLLRMWNRIVTRREEMQFKDLRPHEVDKAAIERQWQEDNKVLEETRRVLETRGAKFSSNHNFDLEGSSPEIQKIVKENGPEG